jgi:CRP-like cAMP-binding protein
MRGSKERVDPSENRLLSSLSRHDYDTLEPHLKSLQLSSGQVLQEAPSLISHCYFLENTVVSFMSLTEKGSSVAVGMVGVEGVVGAAAVLNPHLMPHRAVVLVTGSARSIPIEILRQWCTRNSTLRQPFISYAHAMFTQVVQTSACNRFHDTTQRLTRILLLVQDRLFADTLPFTHESLSEVLGTDRASVTRAARSLKDAGLIDYGRGRVTILDRKGLESDGCECYGVIEAVYDGLLNLRRSASAGDTGSIR